MKKAKNFFMLLLTLICLLGISSTAMAKTKVTKVQMKTVYTLKTQSGYVYGTDKAGNEVWRYQLSTERAAQGFHAAFTSNKKYVFIIDGKNYIRLDKNTGKILKTKKNFLKSSSTIASKAIIADSSNNIYFATYFSSDVYKVNSKGKVLWKNELSNNYCWPYNLKLSGNTLKIKFEAEWSKSTAKLNAKNGKLK